MKKQLIFILFVLIYSTINAQITGGQHVFQFMNVAYSPKIASLGGQNVSSVNNDINMIYANPAMLNQSMLQHVSFNYTSHLPGTNFGSVVYSFEEKSTGLWGGGLNFISYGTMDRTNEGGEVLGEFTANDATLFITKSHKIDPFTIGATVKYARSQLAEFSSSGLFLDFGGLYKHPTKDLSVGMTMRNLGVVFDYYAQEKEAIPFEVQLGTSFKPEHLPLRMSMTIHHIQQTDMVYDDPNNVEQNIFSNEEPQNEEVPLSEQVFRHFTFGGEVILSKHFHVLLGYDRQNRKELKNKDGVGGGAGFSWGFMIHTSKLDINFGKIYYQLGARPTYLSVTSNLNSLLKKKKIEKPNESVG